VASISAPFDEQLRLHEEHVSTVVAAGVRTRYWTYGSPTHAATLVFVHGFRGDHHGLLSFAAELADDFYCVIPDVPGFGETEDFNGQATIDAYAQWLIDFVAASTRSTHAVVIGHSFGSIVVSAALASGLNPQQVVLINPIAKNALRGPRGLMTRLAIFYYWLGASLPEKLGLALLKNRAIVRIMSITMAKTSNKALRAWIHDQHDRYFSNFQSRKSVMQAFRTSVENDVSMFRAGLNRPLLLLVADRDDITDIATQLEFASTLPQAQIEVVSDVGHLVHYEAYGWAAERIRDYIGKNPQ